MEQTFSYKMIDGHGRVRPISSGYIETIRLLRQRKTRAENLLWQNLRSRKLSGFKFLRQHPIGGYVVDFYCHEAKIVIEVDGSIHDDAEISERDDRRVQFFEQIELTVVRFSNRDVLAQTSEVLLMIDHVLYPFPS